MTVSRISTLQDIFNLSLAAGDRELASDFYFEIIGEEQIGILMKGFSVPFISAGEAVEVPGPVGSSHWQASQVDYKFQSAVQFTETVAGTLDAFLMRIVARPGAKFDARIYSGTPDNFSRVRFLRQCLVKIDPADVDHENRQSLLLVSGTLSYHYFGESKPGPRLLTNVR
ncbi:hypothetical protein [Nevskia ramosa]|uniref:hypothetical protein n=1 Tax=Nevskia ramosa TaxID=64002 RepID=UPI003D1392C0